MRTLIVLLVLTVLFAVAAHADVRMPDGSIRLEPGTPCLWQCPKSLPPKQLVAVAKVIDFSPESNGVLYTIYSAPVGTDESVCSATVAKFRAIKAPPHSFVDIGCMSASTLTVILSRDLCHIDVNDSTDAVMVIRCAAIHH